eukprot:CCRYP_015421-RD/>CCRYP_015421-RD protein AED:0.11 eAED:0.14 QI:371/0.75/0.8/1/0.5/0.2/5/0/796
MMWNPNMFLLSISMIGSHNEYKKVFCRLFQKVHPNYERKPFNPFRNSNWQLLNWRDLPPLLLQTTRTKTIVSLMRKSHNIKKTGIHGTRHGRSRNGQNHNAVTFGNTVSRPGSYQCNLCDIFACFGCRCQKRMLDMMSLHNHVGEAAKAENCITASTLHSCAMQLVTRDNEHDQDVMERGIVNDQALQGIIAKEFSRDIEHYLDPAIARLQSSKNQERDSPRELKGKERAMRELVVFYLYKSFMNFCHSKMTLEQLRDESYYKRNWFPLTKNFRKDERAGKLGFPPEIYSLPKSYKFYADTCVKLWELMLRNGIRTFDTEMKKAQLMNARILCSVLLVDECQDLDECQVDFIAKQMNFGTHVFFVGDAAQTIYSFRGARSYHVMSLPNCIDRFLTKSFRFGPAVAQIANIALFVKENSPQTTDYIGKDKKLWIPYRVEGVSREDADSIVTTRSLLQRDSWNKRPVTIIGRKNGTLLKTALDLMNLGHLKQQQDGFDVLEQMLGEQPPSNDLDDFLSSPLVLSKTLPKFHINGKGETSGARMWRKAIKQIECLELNHYVKSIDIIMTYGQNTMKAVKVFEAQLEAKHSEEDADFILTTCNAAKGLEWDFVEICDDFLNLHDKSYVSNKPAQFRPRFLSDSSHLQSDVKPVRRSCWQFAISSYDDELNFIYVACTRAKKILSLPKTIEGVLREYDLLHYSVNDFKTAAVQPFESEESMMVLPRTNKKLSKGEVWALYHDLCLPLRKELGVEDDCNIMKTLFAIDDEEDNLEDGDETTEGTDQIVVKTKEEEHSQHYEC